MAEDLNRELKNSPKTEQAAPLGRKIITVVGVDNYTYWPKLRNAVSDALGVHKLFTEKFGFESPLEQLLNEAVTKDALNELVQDQLPTLLQADDSLIFFFAGHGQTRESIVGGKTVETGYIIPVTAPTDKWGAYLQLNPFLRDLASLPAKHILVILDACRSGFALGSAMQTYRDAVRYEAELTRRVSRKVITSARRDQPAQDGGPVAGHSLFTGTLINGLQNRDADLDKNGLVTSLELGLYLQQRVGDATDSRQTPDFGSFHLDDRGEMVIQVGEVKITSLAVNTNSGENRGSEGPPRPRLPTQFLPGEIERANKQKVLENKIRYLGELKVQQATFGLYTPPYIILQIEDLEKDIAKLKNELGV